MGGKWGAISKLHAFPKAEDHLTQKTLSGAIVTLLGGAIMVLLLAHELSSVLTPEPGHSDSAGLGVATMVVPFAHELFFVLRPEGLGSTQPPFLHPSHCRTLSQQHSGAAGRSRPPITLADKPPLSPFPTFLPVPASPSFPPSPPPALLHEFFFMLTLEVTPQRTINPLQPLSHHPPLHPLHPAFSSLRPHSDSSGRGDHGGALRSRALVCAHA
ncbi:unnamed protein product [Closterium sp. Naga37s-1]|nr:unnamed protein product [Closterium sp. Naga37s-1]